MKDTAIEWATHTFNPWEGCVKVSAGCTNCYAEARAKRLGSSTWGANGTRVVRAESYWKEPLRWNREANWCGNTVCRNQPRPTPGKCYCGLDVERPRVFCASLADVFEDWTGPMTAPSKAGVLTRTSDGWCVSPTWDRARAVTMGDVRRRLFALIDATPGLDWLLVTKRPENINRFTWPRDLGERDEGIAEGDYPRDIKAAAEWPAWRDNVWHIASVEDQPSADRRIPELLKVRSAVHGLSMEPLLEPVELIERFPEGAVRNYLTGQFHGLKATGTDGNPDFTFDTTDPTLPRIGWVIVGGESGHGARACFLDWVGGVVRQCQAAKCPVFVKQLGARPLDVEYVNTASSLRGQPIGLKLADPKGGDMREWPAHLRVRESPTPRGFHG